ncbi:D-aminoacyl-tRNA deacylase [Methylacidimicrobium cyclopophantes]|uniref:D-aminoacyl-tRNA deacylase n=1 Tax=Methylacidimicrobium cyclopophantes TaxID=1041766 RepID=A0A5E6MEK7_9BACT|nr:TatD family hydrolase [Methylacidimicrobium cyclopophantes]VVM06691.1 D-aminoacyl-tRNA deacylase [Methylacidimicrobium cyclopophantes]
MLIDTHAHLYFSEFSNDREEVITRAKAEGVDRIVTVATDLDSSRSALALAQKHPSLACAVGIHPKNAHAAPPDLLAKLEEIAAQPAVVAIGEIGLDYYRLPPDSEEAEREKASQRRIFRDQLAFAREKGLPVIIHQRSSWEDTLAILDETDNVVRCVFHCFGEAPERLRELLRRGHFVSFTGIVTFSNAPLSRASAQAVPMDKFFLETDCPYLAPVPYRGKRCEPWHVRLVAEEIARLRKQPVSEIGEVSSRNARAFFRFAD